MVKSSNAATMFPQAIIPECRELFREYLRNAHDNPGNCNPDVPVILGDMPDRDEWLEKLSSMKEGDPAFWWDAPIPAEMSADDAKISEITV